MTRGRERGLEKRPQEEGSEKELPLRTWLVQLFNAHAYVHRRRETRETDAFLEKAEQQ